jgi:hypothetical protein
MLRGALGLAKFAWILPKVVIFVNPTYIDAVFAALLDLPQAVCVLPLDESILGRVLPIKNEKDT